MANALLQYETPCAEFSSATSAGVHLCTEDEYAWVVWSFRGPSNYRIDASIRYGLLSSTVHTAPIDAITINCDVDICFGYLALEPSRGQIVADFFVCTDVQPVFAIAGCAKSLDEVIFIFGLWVILHQSLGGNMHWLN
jgi:hypothetical protein